jgi:hypothetical protein
MATKKKRGKRFTKVGKWKISSTKGRAREFLGTLKATFNFGKTRLAIFTVPKSTKL